MKRVALLPAIIWWEVAGYGLPGDRVVLSRQEVMPDEAAGLYYLGVTKSGFLYNGDGGAVARVAPYRLLDDGARYKNYFIVRASPEAGIDPARFTAVGKVVRLSAEEVLVALPRGFGAAEIRAVDNRAVISRLVPMGRWVERGTLPAETPPPTTDKAIKAAINSITKEEYGGYIQHLQGYGTRFTGTPGNEAAAAYIRDFFASQGLAATFFEFVSSEFSGGFYPKAGKDIYLTEYHCVFRRTADRGASWDTVNVPGVAGWRAASWLDERTGFVAGDNKRFARTFDGGRSWEVFEFGAEAPAWRFIPYACRFITNAIGWMGGVSYPPLNSEVGGYRGFMKKTVDGGRTWTNQTLPGYFRPATIAFYDTQHGWAGNYYTNLNPTLIYTNDGGATWQVCTDPNNGMIYKLDIAPVGPAEAWAADGTNALLHTTDGVNWTYVYPNAGTGSWTQVEFTDAAHGYAAGAVLIATDDGGQTWREVTAAPEMSYAVLAFADRYHGVAADPTGEEVYLTDDGGTTFENISDGAALISYNVVGERLGYERPDEIVIIGGHYDSYSDQRPWVAPGADDNASGTATAMAAARAFREFAFKRTVRYLAFGDEEAGMVGSAAYANYCAAKGENIIAVLNADMVAYDEEHGGRDDYSICYGTGSHASPWLYEYLVGVGGLYGNNLIYDHYEFYGSDQTPFWSVGYPAIGAIEGAVGVGGVLSYPYYHTAYDLLENCHPALGARFARDYAATFAHLAGVGPVFGQPGPPVARVPRKRSAFSVFPNPYHYGSSTSPGVNFVGLAPPATIEFFDLTGRLVAVVPVNEPWREEFCWRPAANDHRPLAPGLYVYRVKGEGQLETGRLVISE